MRTSMLALGLSLLALLSGVGCKPPASSSVLDGEGASGSVPFYLKMSYSPGTYTIDLGGMRSGGQAAGGLPAGWRLDAGVPRFYGSSTAPFVAAGQPIRLQFEMRLVQDSGTGSSGATGGSRACGGEALNPGGIELRTTSDGTINCDPAFAGQTASAAGSCSDTPPDDLYTCAQQKEWGKCDQDSMKGYCNRTCGRCPNPAATATCADTPPNKDHSCAEQKAWGKCDQDFMRGYCNQTCGRCPAQTLGQSAGTTSQTSTSGATSCSDTPPDNRATCAQQREWGQCDAEFMKGYCDQTCGRCGRQGAGQAVATQSQVNADNPTNPPSAACDDTPPSNNYSCAEQKAWGKCGQDFMRGYCNLTCGRCGAQGASQPAAEQFPENQTFPTNPPSAACDDTPPTNNYTCAQQEAWGKCGQDFMQGYCNLSCGRCGAQGASQPAAEQFPENQTFPASSPADSCDDVPPSSEFTCPQQAGWEKCGEGFMQGYCNRSCGRC